MKHQEQPDIDRNFCKRNKTITVKAGGVTLGSKFPVRIQSMTNTLTSDIEGSVEQCIRIIKKGCDLVRLTVPSLQDISHIAEIRNRLQHLGFLTPIIADVHFNPDIALKVAEFVDKVRINPGNFSNTDQFSILVEKCKKRRVALRIGVNHGSLSQRILEQYGDTPLGMVTSALEFLRICKTHRYDQVVVSMKSSNVRVMVQANRLLVKMMHAEDMHYPVHLGVTEAGEGEDGRIKSAAGIGTLLAEGIGDTIRVSLTEEPENEVPVARKLVTLSEGLKIDKYIKNLRNAVLEPTDFKPGVTRKVDIIGGNNPPVVIGADSVDMTIAEFITMSIEDLHDENLSQLNENKNAVLVYHCKSNCIPAEIKLLHHSLNERFCNVPVIYKLTLHERNREDFQIKATANLAGAFIDGFGNGIWLENTFQIEDNLETFTSFAILQACRARITKTEYIACPSCGRTNFNLIKTLNRIRSVTSHLKHLKIGVMGCIVNGPGEMADADYGYVGSGKGKVTLYKSKTVIKRNIPENEAVKELIELIKANDDWIDP